MQGVLLFYELLLALVDTGVYAGTGCEVDGGEIELLVFNDWLDWEDELI